MGDHAKAWTPNEEALVQGFKARKMGSENSHPGQHGVVLSPRLRPQPQERERDGLLWTSWHLFPRSMPLERSEAMDSSTAADGSPSLWGEGGPKNLFCPFALTLVALVLLSGCGQKPAAEIAAPEIRGEPIAPLAARVSAPAGASVNAATASANSKPETRNSEPTFALAGFDILSGYNIEISDELLGPVTNNLAEVSARTEALIPAKVKALDKKSVALKGFMLPLKVEGGLVTEMLIMKDQSMCCYGNVPKIHEWVSVKMAEKGVKPLMDQAVTLYGKLHVGEMRENGYLTGIYRLDGERMAAPEGN